jgi:hypothetical protein
MTSERCAAVTVIVEPDHAAAWIGLIGVAVGAGLTGGLDLLRTSLARSHHAKQEAVAACDELLALSLAVVRPERA